MSEPRREEVGEETRFRGKAELCLEKGEMNTQRHGGCQGLREWSGCVSVPAGLFDMCVRCVLTSPRTQLFNKTFQFG